MLEINLVKKAVEKSGEMIMKKLHSSIKPTSSTKTSNIHETCKIQTKTRRLQYYS